jgi:ribosomal protein S18 acetylase RimI-like enzyme
MRIEIMQKDDFAEVAEVFRTTFNGLREDWSRESALGHVEQNFFGDAHWVAKENEKIIGFLIGIVLVREAGPELFIDSIAVLPEHQAQGVGAKLWQKAEEFTKQNNFKAIRLQANPALPSYAWYQKMGFSESGWVELFKKI